MTFNMEGKVLVTGSNGQLGQCLKAVVPLFGKRKESYIFTTRKEFDITNEEIMRNYLNENKDIKMIINCAAYTNVKEAETHEGFKQAMLINCTAVKNLAKLCNEFGIFLVHFGTDYMYRDRLYHILPNGVTTDNCIPIEEDAIVWLLDDDFFNQYYGYEGMYDLNKYGCSKLYGVHEIFKEMFPKEKCYKPNFIILVVSWLYSEYGKNFVKTIRERMKLDEKTEVVYTQIGSPTYAMDLAYFILNIIENYNGEFITNPNNYDLSTVSNKYLYYILNFASTGVASWYDMAKIVESIYSVEEKVVPTTKRFDNVHRPSYSVLNLSRAQQICDRCDWGLTYWQDSLFSCCRRLRSLELEERKEKETDE